MPKNAANAEVVDKGCPKVTNYCFTNTLLHEYNLLKILWLLRINLLLLNMGIKPLVYIYFSLLPVFVGLEILLPIFNIMMRKKNLQ